MKLIISSLKIITFITLASGAIGILAFLLNELDTTLVFAFFELLGQINIPFDIFFNYPNVWILFGYLSFKFIVILGINMIKSRDQK
jgi:uncharacterized membrane protein